MIALTRLAATRPLSVSVVAVVIVIFGLYVSGEMDLDLLPEIQSPAVTVTVSASNRPALEMEARFGQRIEQRLYTVRGLRSVEQVVKSGQLMTTVRLNWEVDVDLALMEINQALANIATDSDIESLTVRRFDPRQSPIMVIGMRAKIDGTDLSEIRRLALRQFAPSLEKRKGVAEARVRGGRKKQVKIHVDTNLMQSYGLTLAQVVSRIDAANVNVNVGTLIDNNRVLQLQAQGRFSSAESIGDVIVKYLDGTSVQPYPLKVSDFARIEVTDANVTGLVRVDGKEGLSLSIYKEGGANTVDVSHELKNTLAELENNYPQLHFSIVTDDALLVERAINEVKFAAFMGMFLAIAVLVLFLRSPAPILIVVATIPVSLLGTISAMSLAGFSFNILTLGGLAIGVGLLVDNSIVVIESIYRRRSAGDSNLDSAINGVKAVGGAIVSSTLTTCVVFLPIIFVDGMAAAFVSGIAFTVVISLFTSLATALLFIPALSIWLLPAVQPKGMQIEGYGLNALLEKLLNRPVLMITFSIAIIVISLLGLVRLGTNILPPTEAQQLVLQLQGPPGQNVQATNRVVEQVERIMAQNVGEKVHSTLAEVGHLDVSEQALLGSQSAENAAKILVRLQGEDVDATRIVDRLNPIISQFEQVNTEWQASTSALSTILGVDDGDIVVEVTGPSVQAMVLSARELIQTFERHSALWNVRSSVQGATPQLRVSLKPLAAAQQGVDLQLVSSTLEATLDGLPVTSLFSGDEEIDVRIVTKGSDRATKTASTIEDINFYAGNGQKVRLGDVVEVNSLEGTREIIRRDQRRVVNISIQASDGYSLPDARVAVMSILAETAYPWGVTATLAGDEYERKKNLENFRWLGLLALVLVYMVLTASFESLRHPLVVLSVIPVTVVGVAGTMIPLGQPIGIMAMLGFVILVGIAVNDAILLIHAARQRELLGEAPREAIQSAVQTRLRPIIMTTATTVLALLPLAIHIDAGQFQSPLAWTVIGGVIASTLGSLTVVPCVYMLMTKAKVPRHI